MAHVLGLKDQPALAVEWAKYRMRFDRIRMLVVVFKEGFHFSFQLVDGFCQRRLAQLLQSIALHRIGDAFGIGCVAEKEFPPLGDLFWTQCFLDPKTTIADHPGTDQVFDHVLRRHDAPSRFGFGVKGAQLIGNGEEVFGRGRFHDGLESFLRRKEKVAFNHSIFVTIAAVYGIFGL